jgi:hypothetical protein
MRQAKKIPEELTCILLTRLGLVSFPMMALSHFISGSQLEDRERI